MAASWSSSAVSTFCPSAHSRCTAVVSSTMRRSVQLLELVEVERQHTPAAAKQHLHIPFLLQPHQRLAHRRARDAQPLAEFVLGETVAGHQRELGHVVFELRIDLVGARAVRRRSNCRDGAADGGGCAQENLYQRCGAAEASAAQQRSTGCRPADDAALGMNHLDGGHLEVREIAFSAVFKQQGRRNHGRWPPACWSAHTPPWSRP